MSPYLMFIQDIVGELRVKLCFTATMYSQTKLKAALEVEFDFFRPYIFQHRG